MSNSIRILVIGNSGQLAGAFRQVADEQGCIVKTLGRPDYLFGEEEKIVPVIQSFKPDILINASAWTNVDGAETDIEGARLGNTTAPEKMSKLAAEYDLPFIHVSTDYVFDGKSSQAYLENDATHPLNQYGATKLAGEKAVLQANPHAMVARTAWLFSENNGNFVTTILNAAKQRPELKVTEDQIGNPTSVKALARALIHAAQMILEEWKDDYRGVFHVVAPDITDRLTFVEEIVKADEVIQKPKLTGIKSIEWPLPAERPLNTGLDTSLFKDVYGYILPAWKEQLKEVLLDRSKILSTSS